MDEPKYQKVAVHLCKLQKELKRENILENFAAEREAKLNQELIIFNEHFMKRRKLYFYLIGYYMDLFSSNINPSYFSSLFDEEQTFNTVECKFLRSMRSNINFFRNNIQKLSDAAMYLSAMRKELVNVITFSVIPSLFGLFVHFSDQSNFMLFIENIFEKDEEIALKLSRSIFFMPEFVRFFNIVYNDMKSQFANIRGTTLGKEFADELLECMEKNIKECPRIFQDLASQPYAIKLFTYFFFKIFLYNPLFYGFVQLGDFDTDLSTNFNDIVTIVESSINHDDYIKGLCFVLKNAETTTIDQTYNFVSEIVPAFKSFVYITQYDSQLISVLSSLAKIDKKCVPEDMPDKYNLHVIKLSSLKSQNGIRNSTSGFYEDDYTGDREEINELIKQAERCFIALASNAEIIPMINDTTPIFPIENGDMMNFLSTNLVELSSSSESIKQRMHLLLLKGNYKKFIKRRGIEMSFLNFVSKLMKSISKNTKSSFERASQTQHILDTSNQMKKLSFLMHSYVASEQEFLQNIILMKFFSNSSIVPIPEDSSFKSSKELALYFCSLLTSWKDFCLQIQMSIPVLNKILIIKMMKFYSYEKMIELNPELVTGDSIFAQLVQEGKCFNLDELSDPKIRSILNDESKVSKFDAAIQTIQNAYETFSLQLSLKLIQKAIDITGVVLNSLINSYGMDELTDIFFYIIVKANPKQFISKSEYFYRIYNTLSKYIENIDNETLHSFLLLHQTACLCIKNSPSVQTIDDFFNE